MTLFFLQAHVYNHQRPGSLGSNNSTNSKTNMADVVNKAESLIFTYANTTRLQLTQY